MRAIRLKMRELIEFTDAVGLDVSVPRNKRHLETRAANALFFNNLAEPFVLRTRSKEEIKLLPPSIIKAVQATEATVEIVFGVETLLIAKILEENCPLDPPEIEVQLLIFSELEAHQNFEVGSNFPEGFVSTNPFLAPNDSGLIAQNHAGFIYSNCRDIDVMSLLTELLRTRAEYKVFQRAKPQERVSLRREFFTLHPVFICSVLICCGRTGRGAAQDFIKFVCSLDFHRTHGRVDIFGFCSKSNFIVDSEANVLRLAEKLSSEFEVFRRSHATAIQ